MNRWHRIGRREARRDAGVGVTLRRRGVSLIEVIACTALVAVLIVPVAGVIRASGQSIERAATPSTEAKLRASLRWLRDTVRDGQVISVGNRSLDLQLSNGRAGRVQVVSGRLILDDGANETVLAESVRDIRFTRLQQASPPSRLIGVTMSLRAQDPSTRQFVTVDATVALPTL